MRRRIIPSTTPRLSFALSSLPVTNTAPPAFHRAAFEVATHPISYFRRGSFEILDQTHGRLWDDQEQPRNNFMSFGTDHLETGLEFATAHDESPFETTSTFLLGNKLMVEGISFHELEDTSSPSCASNESPSNESPSHRSPGSLEDQKTSRRSSTRPFESPEKKSKAKPSGFGTSAEERVGHNAMERVRRINIRNCFESLQNAIPGLSCGLCRDHHSSDLRGKRAHSLQILQEAAKYIRLLAQEEREIQRARAELLKANQELRMALASASKPVLHSHTLTLHHTLAHK